MLDLDGGSMLYSASRGEMLELFSIAGVGHILEANGISPGAVLMVIQLCC